MATYQDFESQFESVTGLDEEGGKELAKLAILPFLPEQIIRELELDDDLLSTGYDLYEILETIGENFKFDLKERNIASYVDYIMQPDLVGFLVDKLTREEFEGAVDSLLERFSNYTQDSRNYFSLRESEQMQIIIIFLMAVKEQIKLGYDSNSKILTAVTDSFANIGNILESEESVAIKAILKNILSNYYRETIYVK